MVVEGYQFVANLSLEEVQYALISPYHGLQPIVDVDQMWTYIVTGQAPKGNKNESTADESTHSN